MCLGQMPLGILGNWTAEWLRPMAPMSAYKSQTSFLISSYLYASRQVTSRKFVLVFKTGLLRIYIRCLSKLNMIMNTKALSLDQNYFVLIPNRNAMKSLMNNCRRYMHIKTCLYMYNQVYHFAALWFSSRAPWNMPPTFMWQKSAIPSLLFTSPGNSYLTPVM